MRLIKIILILALVVISVLYGMTMFTRSLDHSADAPSISCDSDTLELSVTDDESVLLTGITAKDRQDGDLTDEVMVSGISRFLETGTSTVSYLVFDSDHNAATLTRTIHYTDYQSPRFSITTPLVYKANETIELLDRIQVTDCLDGDITGSVRVSSLDNGNQEHLYIVTAQVTNSMGDSTQLTLPIIWYENNNERPEIVLTEQLVYLSQGSTFRASDYVAYVKALDGVINKSAVSIDGSVDTSTPGTYLVYYSYAYEINENYSQNSAAVLTVVVE